jgi:hypothetical protein
MGKKPKIKTKPKNEKIKSSNNFEKHHNKKTYMEKHYSSSQCFKEKNYKTKFLTSSILKK